MIKLELFQKGDDISTLPKVEFEDVNHVYRKNNVILPSVTSIMKILSDDIYSTIDPEILANAANRGTSIHQAIEFYDKFNFTATEENEKPYFNAYLDYREEHNVIPIANEIKLYHKQLLYAGTLDAIAIVDGKVTLVDYKTTSVLHTNLVSVQLAGYLMALESWGLTVEQVAVLQIKKDGTYVYKLVDVDKLTFKACLQIQDYKNRKGD